MISLRRMVAFAIASLVALTVADVAWAQPHHHHYRHHIYHHHYDRR